MRNRFVFASLSVVALVAVACGGGAGATTRPATSAPSTPGAATSAPSSAAPTSSGDDATGASIEIASTDLGDILVDGEGRTLYAFTPDESTGEPTCYEDCADNWPALTVEGDDFTVGEGLDQAEFSTAERTDDAGTQVVFGTYPLYYFAGDEAAGDTNGQGLGGKWYVIGADGQLIKDEPAAT